MSAPQAGIDATDPEILGIFIEESAEALGRCESLLLEAESGGDLSADKMATMFRDFHTLKGTASFLAMPNITRLAHAAEDLMARLRDCTLAPHDRVVLPSWPESEDLHPPLRPRLPAPHEPGVLD